MHLLIKQRIRKKSLLCGVITSGHLYYNEPTSLRELENDFSGIYIGNYWISSPAPGSYSNDGHYYNIYNLVPWSDKTGWFIYYNNSSKNSKPMRPIVCIQTSKFENFCSLREK